MRTPHLVSQVQHAHLRVLHLEHAVLQQELAAQVIEVRCPHRVHSLAGRGGHRDCVSAAHPLRAGLPPCQLPQTQPALRVWKYCRVSLSYRRGSSALISKMMVSRHPGERAGKRAAGLIWILLARSLSRMGPP